ncbi:MAG: deoxyribose-phosphate aldolase [Planctomycetota bacterium]|nr:deoxyribose-phosphate aldolase [Planctomycetota bacterium]
MSRRSTVDAVMAAERAASFATRSLKGATKRAGLRLALSMMDLTTLEGKDTPEKARALCRKAVRPWEQDEAVLGERLPSAAAVCVYPSLVPACVDALRAAPGGERVKIASVATGFPSGQYPLEVRLEDVRRAVADGAHEIDMVISRGAFLAGDLETVGSEIVATKRACRRADGTGASLKVILETGELETLDAVRRASDLALDALASAEDADAGTHAAPDFIKTSTGKVTPAATMPVTLVMLEAIRAHFFRTGRLVGMKPAGGIRSAKQALHYLVMVRETMNLGVPGFEHAGGNPWLTPEYFRFGASALCNDLLRQIARGATGSYHAGYDFSEA